MDFSPESREEKRLNYNWPVWFADIHTDGLSQGQMVDICSNGAAFTCYADKCPNAGQTVTARFSVPRYNDDDSFDLANFVRQGQVARVDEVSTFVRKVAFTFAEPLPFKPGEVTDTEALLVDEDFGIGTAEMDEKVESVVAE